MGFMNHGCNLQLLPECACQHRSRKKANANAYTCTTVKDAPVFKNLGGFTERKLLLWNYVSWHGEDTHLKYVSRDLEKDFYLLK